MLIPSNSTMEPMMVPAKDVHILGKVIQARRNFEQIKNPRLNKSSGLFICSIYYSFIPLSIQSLKADLTTLPW
jgi:hypothetical protein